MLCLSMCSFWIEDPDLVEMRPEDIMGEGAFGEVHSAGILTICKATASSILTEQSLQDCTLQQSLNLSTETAKITWIMPVIYAALKKEVHMLLCSCASTHWLSAGTEAQGWVSICLQVYRGHVEGLGTVAVKTLKQSAQCYLREFKKEVGIVRDCVHPNIVRALGACNDPVGPLVYLGEHQTALPEDLTIAQCGFSHPRWQLCS